MLDKKYLCKSCPVRSELFKDLSDSELSKVSNHKMERTYTKGQFLCKEGEPIQEFIYLKSGLLKLHKRSTMGKDKILNVSKPLDFVGLLSAFSENTYIYSITAIEDSVICAINLEQIKELIKGNQVFGCKILREMSTTYDNILKFRFEIEKRNSKGRLAFIILHLADNIYEKGQFNLPISRKEIAQIIDISTESVIRNFSEFRKDGLIKIDGSSVEILNKKTLKLVSLHG